MADLLSGKDSMSDEKILTKEIAKKFLADPRSVDVNEFTTMDPEARQLFDQEGWYLLPHVGPGRQRGLKKRLPKEPISCGEASGSALTCCPDCDQQISKQARSCPHCGKPMPNVPSGTYAIFLAVGVLGALGTIYFIAKDNKRNAEIENLRRNPPSSMEELNRRINSID